MSGAPAGQEKAREAETSPAPGPPPPRERLPLRLPRDPPRGCSGLSPHSPFTFPRLVPAMGSPQPPTPLAARRRKCPDAPAACCTRARMREEGKGACEAEKRSRDRASREPAARDAPPEGAGRDGLVGG